MPSLHKHNVFIRYCSSVFFNVEKPKPSGYWNNDVNVLQFLEKLKENFRIKETKDWNAITNRKIKSLGGSALLNKYSVYELKCMGCPEGKEIFKKPKNKIKAKPQGFWNKKENIHKFLEELKDKYNLNSLEKWDKLTQKQIILLGGSTLLQKHSLHEIKNLGYPEGKNYFEKSRIPYKPTGYWDKEENILKFIDKIKQKLNLNNFDDWNLLTRDQILSLGGGSLFRKYTIFDIKCLGFPEGKNQFKKAIVKTNGFWNDKENIHNFIKDFGNFYQLKSKEDWNLINCDQIQSFGGSTLLNRFSLYEIKCFGYPKGAEYFNKPKIHKPFGFWKSDNNINNFIEKLKDEFNLETLKDWNRLSKNQILSLGGSGLLSKYSVNEICNLNNIENNNSSLSEKKSMRSSQRFLFLQIKKLFPHEEIIEDYFHPEISRESGFPIQFDIFLVDMKIAIEYHGKQHYEDIPAAFAPLEMYQQRDKEKKLLCNKFGINLIVIPYWWDNTIDSLQDTINSKINK